MTQQLEPTWIARPLTPGERRGANLRGCSTGGHHFRVGPGGLHRRCGCCGYWERSAAGQARFAAPAIPNGVR